MASSHSMKLIHIVYDTLHELGLQPSLIPRGKIGELRGGNACIDLKKGGGIDSVVLMSKTRYETSAVGQRRHLHRLDYAIRGTIKGTLPGRIIATTKLETKGLFRKKLTTLSWVIPTEQNVMDQSFVRAAKRPQSGEVWDGGPHDFMIELLKREYLLERALFKIAEKIPINLKIQTDGWGESVRICCDRWMEEEDMRCFYLSPLYIRIADDIGRIIKETRRKFGGLSF